VVQHPLQLKLQLFKTPDKGWGIRCLNDIPQGTFICIYAGQLLTEQAANEVRRFHRKVHEIKVLLLLQKYFLKMRDDKIMILVQTFLPLRSLTS